MATDLQYAWRARRAGAHYSYRIVKAARKAGIPLSIAFAVVEQESDFKNIFGCDQGSILCHKDVTHERVQQLLNYVRRGGTSNGVGLTQLTFPPFIKQAEALGGAHYPRHQLTVGFGVIRDLYRRYGRRGLWRYNGSTAYQVPLDKKIDKWHRILTRG